MMIPVQIWADTTVVLIHNIGKRALSVSVISDIRLYLVTVHGSPLVVEAPRLAPAGARV